MRLAAAAGSGHQLSVIVASRNGVKINAIAAALRQALPDIKHNVVGRPQPGLAVVPWHPNKAPLRTSKRVLHSTSALLLFSALTIASWFCDAGSDSQAGVADQPIGDEETLRGAYNRVASCLWR
jgi:non-canonical (house-cleaning) NTP pyrophosphatase